MSNNTQLPCETQDNLTPDPLEAQLHLKLLFGDVEKEYPDGIVEIRAIKPDNRGAFCRFYPCSEAGIEEAIKEAQRPNLEGWNIYVGLNPRKPGTSGSGTNKDVEIAFAVYADLDCAASQKIFSAGAPLQPSFIIRTGSVPHPRRHLYWLLETPIRNLEVWKELMRGVENFFQGDSISDLPRVARVAGFISWPPENKKVRGYKAELVRLEMTDEG
jgi:hypothetical protein